MKKVFFTVYFLGFLTTWRLAILHIVQDETHSGLIISPTNYFHFLECFEYHQYYYTVTCRIFSILMAFRYPVNMIPLLLPEICLPVFTETNTYPCILHYNNTISTEAYTYKFKSFCCCLGFSVRLWIHLR